MSYNGYTNWETWHTALLIDNEYDLYQIKEKCVRSKCSQAEFKKRLYRAETMTKNFWKESIKGKGGDNDTFEKVNWKEIYQKSMEEEY